MEKTKIKCPNCAGTGRIAVGELCSWCWGDGTIEVELSNDEKTE